jgi:DNA-binding PadR family transcriptional regulator
MAELSSTAKKILESLAADPERELGYEEVRNTTGRSMQSIVLGFRELKHKELVEQNQRDNPDWANPREMYRITVEGLNYLESL